MSVLAYCQYRVVGQVGGTLPQRHFESPGVLLIRLPGGNSGGGTSSNQWSRSRKLTTSPIIVTTGEENLLRAALPTISCKVPTSVSCALRVPQRTSATGV